MIGYPVVVIYNRFTVNSLYMYSSEGSDPVGRGELPFEKDEDAHRTF